jgi:large subunit ribosomal protein L13
MTDYPIDGKNKRLGRLASEIAVILQGKRSPAYHPRLVGKDRVLLSNYAKVVVTGSKEVKKIYHRHTGYMGHLKKRTFGQAFERDPKKVIRDAVRRMLPKNFLNQKRLQNLVFIDHE